MNETALVVRPPCTVLLPAHNIERYCDDIVGFLVGALSPKDEILIINDGSTDATLSKVKSWEKKSTNIRLIDKQHTGLVDSLNVGIQEAAHEFIARVDGDDQYFPERFDLQIAELEKNPCLVVVFSDYEITLQNGKSLGTICSAITPAATKLSLVSAARTAHPSAMFRKSKVLEAGGYYQEDYPAEDLGLWIRLSQSGEMSSVPATLLKYNVNPSGITQSKKTEMILKRNNLIRSMINQNDHTFFLNELKNTKKIYQNYPKGNERLAIHLAELALFVLKKHMSLGSKMLVMVRLIFHFFNLKILRTLFLLHLSRVKRRKVIKSYVSARM